MLVNNFTFGNLVKVHKSINNEKTKESNWNLPVHVVMLYKVKGKKIKIRHMLIS